MHLAIDASNIRMGGGVTHLSQLLNAANPVDSGIGHVTVWACAQTADQLPTLAWLTKLSPDWTESSLFIRLLAQHLFLGDEIESHGCSVLFSPGGTVPFRIQVPVVTMSQNMLPFEPEEALHFGRWNFMRLKMWLLRKAQTYSFKKAAGLIFLTKYARNLVVRQLAAAKGSQVLIPHGIESRFASSPKEQKTAEEYSFRSPFTFLYVSILMPYKHQIEVAKAACELRLAGYPVRVKFVGAGWGWYGHQFRKILKQLDPEGEFLSWSGSIPFSSLHAQYHEADAFLFASSCENLPNILIEAMAAGLPIACSNRGPMPEVLGTAGVYFDPVRPHEIASAMRKLIDTLDLRVSMAKQAYELSLAYSWRRCAKETFEFIAAVAAQRDTLKETQR